MAEPHQILPGVGDGGHAGVGDEGAAFPSQQPFDDGRAFLLPVVLVVADKLGADIEAVWFPDSTDGPSRITIAG